VNREPRIALSLVDTRNPYRYLEIRGVIDRIDENLAFIDSTSKKYRGVDEHQNHLPGAERVVVFMRPQHTTKMGG